MAKVKKKRSKHHKGGVMGRSDIPYAQRIQIQHRSDVAFNREQAAKVTMFCMSVAMHEVKGIAYKRLVRFHNRYMEYEREFYQDQEVGMAHAKSRMEQMGMALEIRPIHVTPAKEYVKQYHRHNIPPVGGKFAIAVYENDRMCGVAICGRPTARRSDDGLTLEIYRNCTDGTKNACSKLYGACLRIAKDMGYKRVITYTLASENGASLKASNFICEGKAGGIAWTGSRKRNYYVSPEEMKKRWAYYMDDFGSYGERRT